MAITIGVDRSTDWFGATRSPSKGNDGFAHDPAGALL
jgi:hypothetical protein